MLLMHWTSAEEGGSILSSIQSKRDVFQAFSKQSNLKRTGQDLKILCRIVTEVGLHKIWYNILIQIMMLFVALASWPGTCHWGTRRFFSQP